MCVCMCIYIYVCVYDAGLPHPPSPPPPPPPHGIPPCLSSGSCLVWPCCVPRLVLFGLVPSPPCGVGSVVFLVGPAPPVGGSVFYRGMVWLLPLVSSTVIVTSPPPPVGRPRLCGAVCSTEIWYGCCRLFAVMSSLRARYDTRYDVALFSLAGIILHRPPSLWFAWVRSGCAGPLGEPLDVALQHPCYDLETQMCHMET